MPSDRSEPDTAASQPARVLQAASQVLPELALRAAFGSAAVRSIRKGKFKAIIVNVPGAEWVGPIALSAEQLLGSGNYLAITERGTKYNPTPSASGLARNELTVGISHSEALLPQALRSLCEMRVKVEATPALITDVARRCLRGRVDSDFSALAVSGLDLTEIYACLPLQGTVKQSRERFARAIAAKSSGPSTRALPDLEAAHGYGVAQAWALDLTRDIADLRAGKIGWNDVDRGVVLHGPPGTGKSLFAQIVAKACELPIVISSIGEWFEQGAGYLDSVIKAQRATFDRARAMAPSLLFIDEVSSLPRRDDIDARGRSWWTPVVDDFLIQLDGAVGGRDGVLVIGATNALDRVDPALLRPGRLERAIYVGPPDAAGLAGILHFHLGDDLQDVNLMPLAQMTPGATGAQAMEWTRAARRKARREGCPVSYEHLREIMAPDDGRSEAELLRTATHEAGHAVMGVVLGLGIERVTILLNGGQGGRSSLPRPATGVFVVNELEDRVVQLLSGRAAEQVIVDAAPSTGAGGDADSDLAKATSLLAMIHLSWGLGEGLIWRGPMAEAVTLLAVDPQMQAKVEADLKRLMTRALQLVSDQQAAIGRVAEALLQRRVLSGPEVEHIIETAASPASPPVERQR